MNQTDMTYSLISHKRTPIDILADIVKTLSEEGASSQTKVALRCSLDTRASKRYIQFLIEKQLAIRTLSNTLQITDEGRMFLQEYQKILTMIDYRPA